MSDLLELAIELAKQAGKEVIRIYKQGFNENQKQDKSPVTCADLASEKMILQGLEKTGLAVLSEETSPNDLWYKQDKVWMVDPLDGTKDFIQKTGEFSIMLGLVSNKTPVLGVIYHPTEDILYFAEKNKGAFEQKRGGEVEKIQVSDISDFGKSNIILSRNHTSKTQKDFVKKVGFRRVKHMGSAGLKIAEVASGRAEAYFTESPKIHQWDTAAGECILTEANGIVTDLKGNSLTYCNKQTNHSNGLLACNKTLYPKLIQALNLLF